MPVAQHYLPAQGGCINVLRSPIGCREAGRGRQEEVAQALEAISGAAQVQGRPWQVPQPKRRRREGAAAPSFCSLLVPEVFPKWSMRLALAIFPCEARLCTQHAQP
jgi:hypothetical protein